MYKIIILKIIIKSEILKCEYKRKYHVIYLYI